MFDWHKNIMFLEDHTEINQSHNRSIQSHTLHSNILNTERYAERGAGIWCKYEWCMGVLVSFLCNYNTVSSERNEYIIISIYLSSSTCCKYVFSFFYGSAWKHFSTKIVLYNNIFQISLLLQKLTAPTLVWTEIIYNS